MLQKTYRGEQYTQHVGGYFVAALTITPGAGAGPNAIVSITNGDDVSGVISVVTSALDTPAANATIVTVTFGTAYSGGVPRVHVQPANAAAWDLAHGVVRVVDANDSASAFLLSSGPTPLPAQTGATYLWSYMVVGRSV